MAFNRSSWLPALTIALAGAGTLISGSV